MIALVLFANQGTVAKQSPIKFTYNDLGQRTASKAPPLFVLQSPAIASNNLEAGISVNQPASVDQSPMSSQFSSQKALLESSGDSSQSVFSKQGGEQAPDVIARITLVTDFGSGAQYVNHGAEDIWPLASLTKLMTAIVSMGKLDPDQKVAITPEAFAADPSEQLLRTGDVYSISDLLKIMLLPSSNVAAEAIASAHPAGAEKSGREAFIAAMNARAAAWGMANTHFDDPSGISAGSKSTAHDIFIFAKKIYAEYPQVFTITKIASTYATELNSGKRVLVKSINNFAGQANFIGGKTGYTDEAGGNLLSVFSYRQKPLLIVVMGTDDRFGDTQKLLEWFEANYK